MFQSDFGSCMDQSCGQDVNKSKFEPITPVSYKENGDFPLDLTSPLTVVKHVSKVLDFDSKITGSQLHIPNDDEPCSPRTPKDGVFDPFAPGPDDKLWAPLCKKYSDEPRGSVARRLSFTSSFQGLGDKFDADDEMSVSDQQIFESVYENLLALIVSVQTECAVAQLSIMDLDSDSCWTPPSAPRLTGIAESCPDAPMKPSGRLWSIDLGLCRKLEF